MTSDEFARKSLKQKHQLIQEQSEFVAQRIHGSHNIQLYAIHGFYVEVWKKLGLDYLQWIEVVKDDNILLQYTSGIDLNLNDLFK